MQLFLIRLCAVLMLLSLAIGTLAQSQARSSQEQTSTTPPPQRILSPDDDLLGLASKQGNYAHYYLLPSMSYGKDNLAITNTFSGSNLVRKGGEYPLLYQWKLGFSESMPLLRGKSSASYTFQLSNQIYRSDTLLLSIFGTYVRGLVSPSSGTPFKLESSAPSGTPSP